MDFKQKNVLVVYFSHKGENYSNGSIVELKKGNTAIASEMIASLTEADLFEIEAVTAYPFEYHECTEVAKAELNADARPTLVHDIDIQKYDVIFIGYPNWWSTMPMPVWTFLDQHDFTSKTVLPFCTHEGSGMGKSEADIKRLINADIRKGLAIRGSNVVQSLPAIQSWIDVQLKNGGNINE